MGSTAWFPRDCEPRLVARRPDQCWRGLASAWLERKVARIAMRPVVLALFVFAIVRTVLAAEPPPRRGEKLVVTNDDGFSSFFAGRLATVADLRAEILSYRDTPIAVLEWCVYAGSRANFPAKATELVGHGVTDFGRRGDKLVAETLRRFVEQGVDTLNVVAAAAREAGIRCYASLRMNGDYAESFMEGTATRQFNSQFWRDHPEWRVRGPKGEDRTKLSFAFPEVRAWKLALLREAAERDIDGLNLDFLRHPPFVGYEEPMRAAFREKYRAEPAGVADTDPRWHPLRGELMTRFVRDVRRLLDEEGRRKGRRLGLSARIDWREWRQHGCDLETWLREGLLDYVVIAQRTLGGYEIDLAPFVAMARGTGCAVLFGEEAITSGHDLTAKEDRDVAAGKMKEPVRDRLTPAKYRERATRWYAAGADGVHLFNESDRAIMRLLGTTQPAPVAR